MSHTPLTDRAREAVAQFERVPAFVVVQKEKAAVAMMGAVLDTCAALERRLGELEARR